jgi:CD2 antigen cytoplasmic tail-binding protein 2
MRPRSSQKRAATNSNAEASSSSHAAKKTRFVDPSEDPENFAEEVESALENPAANRKGRVKNEGYDSDSSDDGEGVVESRKKDRAAANEEDEDDMFAMADKEDKAKEISGKKEEKFLRLGDIQGQEFNSRSGSEDESEDEPEDEDDAERRKKAGMGYELSSFNMRDEMEEGKFTEDGSYVRTFDPHGVHDRWMDGLSEKEIKQARKRKRQQEKVQQEKIAAEERELEESGGKGALEKQLLPLLKKGETILEALQRLGVKAKKNRKTQVSNRHFLFVMLIPKTGLKRRNQRHTLIHQEIRLYLTSRRSPSWHPISCLLVRQISIQKPTRNLFAPSARRVSLKAHGSLLLPMFDTNTNGTFQAVLNQGKPLDHSVKRI